MTPGTKAIQGHIENLMSDGRERTASEITDWFLRNQMVVNQQRVLAHLRDLRDRRRLFYERGQQDIGIWCASRPLPQGREGKVIEGVAKKHDVSVEDVIGPDVDRKAAKARGEAMFILFREGMDVHTIGKLFLRSRETVYRGMRLHRLREEAKAKQAMYARAAQ